MEYIARIRETDGKPQPLIEHLEGVAELSKKNAAVFGAGGLAYACGRVHDIGKYSQKFQRRIRGEKVRTDHSTAGGQWLCRSKNILAMIAAYCCMGHHAGLPDGGDNRDMENISSLHCRLKKPVEDYSAGTGILGTPLTLEKPAVKPRDGFAFSFFTRMLFSSLVDADFIDTETFMQGGETVRGGSAGMKQLHDSLMKHVSLYLSADNAEGSLNAYRTNLLKQCLAAAEKHSGLFTLTAPTGSGKTKSALAFALKHAVNHGKRRIIYIAPYNTIIEQNAEVFEEILGAENVLRHYGNHYYDVDEQSGESESESEKKRLSAENWDFPMVTTSSVQFFQSLFATRPSVCRKLHNIAGSVIILDEAQMIPAPFLIPCARAIAELVSNYGCTIVLATATQAKLDKYLGLSAVEIAENPAALHEALRRNRIHFLREPLSDSGLIERLSSEAQVLCIVNTRHHAQKIFKELRGRCGVDETLHLSTTMCHVHRVRILNEIRLRLKNGQPCRVISTSLVEAGVELDFPMVYRAEAGLDSTVQAAGRCNREGLRPVSESNVYVFIPEECKPPQSIKVNIETAIQTLRTHEDPASPDTITDYFERLFYIKGEEQLDVKKILPMMNESGKGCYPFRQAAEAFQLIDMPTEPVYVLGEAPEIAKQLRSGERNSKLFRLAADYAVNLYTHEIDELNELGALERVSDRNGKFDGIYIVVEGVSHGYYDSRYGVHLKPESGKAAGLF